MKVTKQILPLSFLLIFLITTVLAQQPGRKIQNSSINEELTMSTQSEEAKEALETALFYFDLYDQDKAREYANMAIEADPNFAMAYLIRAYGSNNSSDFSRNINKADELSTNASPAEKAMIAMGKTYLKGDVEERLMHAKEVVEAVPNSSRAYIALGNVYSDMNDYQQAREAYKKAAELSPGWLGSYVMLANSYIFEDPKDTYSAIENAKKVTELAPDAALAYIQLGDAYRSDNNLMEAAKQYEMASTKDPENAIALIKLGHANTYLGKYDEARQNYRKAIEIDDAPIGAANYEAYTYLYEGNPDNAMAALDKYMNDMSNMGIPEEEQDNAKMFTLNSLSWVAFDKGNAEKLKELNDMRKSVSSNISNAIGTNESKAQMEADQLFWAAMADIVEGNYDQAEQETEQMKTALLPIKDPNKLEDYHFAKGEIAYKQDNFSDAIEHFEEANLQNQYHKYMLAQAHEKAGDQRAADLLYTEIANYNFNSIDYALVRNEVMNKMRTAVSDR